MCTLVAIRHRGGEPAASNRCRIAAMFRVERRPNGLMCGMAPSPCEREPVPAMRGVKADAPRGGVSATTPAALAGSEATALGTSLRRSDVADGALDAVARDRA